MINSNSDHSIENIIPITMPLMGEKEARAAAEVVASGWLTQGPKAVDFENAVCNYIGATNGIAVSSCTAALVLALLASGVGVGDEVITTPYSFIATANAIVATGAVPVFADIDLETYNLDPVQAAQKITSRTKALLPVDQLGLPCDLQAFQKLADSYGLFLIQDAACALGSRYRGYSVGGDLTKGQCACFSFHPRKVITTGEGGMIVCNDDELANKARSLASHGTNIDDTRKHESTEFLAPDYYMFGHNFRMSDILAAIGVEQMHRLPDVLSRRRELGDRYNSILKNNERIIIPSCPPCANTNYQTYQVRIDGASRHERNELVNRLREKGVMATFGVADIHRQKAYLKRFGRQLFPNAELAADTSIILPLFPQMSDQDQQRCAEELLNII